MMQFPTIIIGSTHARDTSNISTQSLDIGLSIPIFNGNRGNVAIEDAMCQRFYDEYSSRLSEALSDVDELLVNQGLTWASLASYRINILYCIIIGNNKAQYPKILHNIQNQNVLK
jgi:outer membrane protein TolC